MKQKFVLKKRYSEYLPYLSKMKVFLSEMKAGTKYILIGIESHDIAGNDISQDLKFGPYLFLPIEGLNVRKVNTVNNFFYLTSKSLGYYINIKQKSRDEKAALMRQDLYEASKKNLESIALTSDEW